MEIYYKQPLACNECTNKLNNQEVAYFNLEKLKV